MKFKAYPSRYLYLILGLIIAVGIALRLWLIAVSSLDPAFSNADDGDYYRRALRFAMTGQYLDDAWLIRPPLHVFFFATWIRLALVLGQPLQALLYVQLAQLAVAALTIALGYGVARRLFHSNAAGLIFAAFLATWQPFVEQSDVLFSELLYLFLFLAHVWLLLIYSSRAAHGERLTVKPAASAQVYLILSGMALGLAALTRSPALYALAFVVLWLIVRHLSAAGFTNMPRLIGQAALVCAGCLVIVLPWTARNYLLYGHFIPVDTLGQINLWLDLDRVEDRSPNIELLRTLPQSERAPYAMARARELLAVRPLRIFDNAWPNFQHIWKAQFIEDYFLKSSFFTRSLREMAVLGLFGDALWLIFTLSGLIMLAGRPSEGWHWRLFFLAWIAYSMLTVIVFHVEPRYLTPLWTLISLYGAAGLARLGLLASAIRVFNKRHVLQLAIVLAFLALLLSYRDYPAIIGRGMAREQAMHAAQSAYQQGDYGEAERHYAEALRIQPSFVDARVGQALALAAQNRIPEAQSVARSGGSRQADLLGYALQAISSAEPAAIDSALQGVDDTAAISGEDSQEWLMRWLHRPAAAQITLGSQADIGRIHGFHAIENSPEGSYRWLRGDGAIQFILSQPVTAGDTLMLRMNTGRPNPVALAIRIGNGPAQHIEVQPGQWRRYLLSMPPSAYGSTRLLVTLSAPVFVPALSNPASDDLRFLSLMLSEAAVQ